MQEDGGGTGRVLGTLAFSLVVHVLAYVALVFAPVVPLQLPQPPDDIEIVAVTEPVPEPPPEPEAEPEPEAPPEPAPESEPEPEPIVRRERVVRSLAPSEPPPPSAEPPAPVEEQIAEFMGETLTNDQGPGWSSAVGNGEPIEGPIGGPTGIATGRRRQGAASGEVGGTGTAPAAETRVVPFSDLSRQPRPRRDMNALLQRNYPPRARQLGVEGRAVIGFRIMPDGAATRLRTRSESPSDQGFAEACRRTVQQADWEPPLAQDGTAVATDATFECEFAISL